jgi:hypothetical protein
MDQKEIDALINQGSVEEFNKKQEELIKNLTDKSTSSSAPIASDSPPIPPVAEKKGKVMGQLSRVTEESEAGTNMVMGYLENVLNLISKQHGFIQDMSDMYQENPTAININEALSFVGDNLKTIEEAIFSAMDAFQFQDIGRQKLMKVMYTLAKLNEYLNELLGGETEKDKTFGNRIEKKTMEQDKDKSDVDEIVAGFQKETAAQAAEDTSAVTPSPPQPESSPSEVNADDVDSIVAQFNQEKQKEEPPSSGPLNNSDIDSLIAEFQNQNKQD